MTQDPLPGRGLAIPFTKAANPKADLGHDDLRLPFVRMIPDNIRNHFVACIGEFCGTFLFLFFALSGTQVANSIPSSAGLTVAQTGSNPQQLQYIALCFGFSLAVNAWVFFRISGGLFNPAVTFGMCLIGALPWVRGALLFIAQLLGGMASAAIVSCMFPGNLNVETTLGEGTSVVQGLFIEMFLTAQLVFTIFMLAAEKHKGTFIAPVGIGLALFIAELTGVYFTGGSLNPARSFGPAVVNVNFVSYHWIYWLGPILGSIMSAGLYKLIKVLEYETANPGQDMDHAANVQKRKDLLMAAGINEQDAEHVANELSEKNNVSDHGGPNGNVIANGQGRQNQSSDPNGMYGTEYRNSSKENLHKTNAGNRPGLNGAGSQVGRYSYLGKSGRQPSTTPRTDSPAMATQEEVYAPLAQPHDEPLGGMVRNEDNTRQRFARTASSGV